MPFLSRSCSPRGGPPARSFPRANPGLWLGLLLLAQALRPEVVEADNRSRLSREYDLKAVFLFNFTQFVDWPPQAFPAATTPFVIGVLGDDPFGKSLDDVVANETVGGRKLVVRRFRDLRELDTCQLLFISQSQAWNLKQIFRAVEAHNILTVGESDGFSAAGGVIRFVMVQNKVRLRINVRAAEAAGLVISSKLLRQAELEPGHP